MPLWGSESPESFDWIGEDSMYKFSEVILLDPFRKVIRGILTPSGSPNQPTSTERWEG